MTIYDCLNRCISTDEKNSSQIVKQCMSDCQPEKFTAPLIWVGFYIAGASLVCMLAMGTDLVIGLRMKKSWFPCKYFTLNAAISALLAIALKMPVDLSTSMPCGRDQLMKLSATALMSVSMGNFMPSLAAMSDPELFANLMALAVFIVPLISNICIQIGTEVIYQGVAPQHTILMCCISIQFALLVSTAIACPTMKQQLEDAYNKDKDTDKDLKLRRELMKQWIMAQTSSPQFVIARSVICTASGAICVLTVLVLAESVIQLHITMSKNLMFFFPSSDYEWSANAIVSVQAAAVIVGSISPISRWFTVVWFNFEKCTNSPCKDLWSVDPYWTKRLKDLKNWHLGVDPRHVKFNNFIGKGKHMALEFFTKFQNFTVVSSKFLCLVSLVFLYPFMYVYNKIVTPKNNIDDETSWVLKWVLKLDKEPDLPKSTIMKIISVAESHIKKGKKKAISESQINLPKKSDGFDGFDGIKEFDKKFIEELTKINIDGVSNNPNGSWAIRIVTLSTIICAIKWEEEFVFTVNAILPLVIYVENALSHGATARQTKIDVGYLAMNVWSKVYNSKKWLNTELPIKIKESLDYRNGEALKKILETLQEPSQKKQRDDVIIEEEWMKKTAEIFIKELLSSGKLNGEKKIEGQQLHEKMTRMVLDMLVACLVNIKRAIFENISNASIEKRESVVKEALSIHGKTKEIQSFVKERFSTVKKDHREYLDASWWKIVMPKIPLEDAIKSSTTMSSTLIGDDDHPIDIESKSISKRPIICWSCS